ncbi:hypothetical protein D3C71_1258710 [compost metagenome]
MDVLATGHALEPPAPVRFPHQSLATLPQLAHRAMGQRFSHRREQYLPGPGKGHQACSHRLGQAFDLQRFSPDLDRLGAVLPRQHFADMQPRAGTQHDVTLLADLQQAALIVQRKAETIDGPLEQQQQAIGAIDQATIPLLLQHQHQPVMLLEQLRRRGIANPLHQDQRIAQIGEQQRPHLRGLGRRSVVAVHADLPIRVWRSLIATSAIGCRPAVWPGTAHCRRGRTTRSSRSAGRSDRPRC